MPLESILIQNLLVMSHQLRTERLDDNASKRKQNHRYPCPFVCSQKQVPSNGEGDAEVDVHCPAMRGRVIVGSPVGSGYVSWHKSAYNNKKVMVFAETSSNIKQSRFNLLGNSPIIVCNACIDIRYVIYSSLEACREDSLPGLGCVRAFA